MGGQCSIDSMGTETFQNYCNWLLTLYKCKVYSLFGFPYLVILICVYKANVIYLLILVNILQFLG